MKLRTLIMSKIFLEDMMKGCEYGYESDAPKDLEILGVIYKPERELLELVVRSESFEDIPDTFPFPYVQFIFKKILGD